MEEREYFEGEMVEMPGVKLRLKLGHARYTRGNLRLRVAATDFYTYPDVMVICGDPEIDGDQDDIVLNPALIGEVLFESTEAYDRGEKFQRYRKLPSLIEYLLVAQDAPRIEQWIRQPDDNWLRAEISGRDASIQLASIDCVLPLAEIYDKIDLPRRRHRTPYLLTSPASIDAPLLHV